MVVIGFYEVGILSGSTPYRQEKRPSDLFTFNFDSVENAFFCYLPH